MKKKYNSSYSELNVKSLIGVKVLLVIFIVIEGLFLYTFLREDNYINPFSSDPYYSMAKVEIEKETINDKEVTKINKLNIIGVDFNSNEVVNVNIPVDAVSEYTCSNYSSYIYQLNYTQSQDCMKKSIESILNISINDMIIVEGDQISETGRVKVYETIKTAKEISKLTESDKILEVKDYTFEQWSSMFSLYDFDANLINETSVMEFQKQLRAKKLDLKFYDVKKSTINTEVKDGVKYLETKSRQENSDIIRNLLNGLTTSVPKISEFQDNGNLGLWPESTYIEVYNPETEDKDLDGIPDFYDSCPEEGYLTFDENVDGCEDTMDLEQPASISDADSDGILDDADLCPTVIGNNIDGCYYPNTTISDADSDGVNDDNDSCPNNPGNSEDGCYYNEQPSQPEAPTPSPSPPVDPDSDGDGINDVDDECPDTVGNSPNGCYITPEEPPIEEQPPTEDRRYIH